MWEESVKIAAGRERNSGLAFEKKEGISRGERRGGTILKFSGKKEGLLVSHEKIRFRAKSLSTTKKREKEGYHSFLGGSREGLNPSSKGVSADVKESQVHGFVSGETRLPGKYQCARPFRTGRKEADNPLERRETPRTETSKGINGGARV